MSGVIKPLFGTQLKKDHPLSMGLVGCWLFNEGSGNKVYDSSGQGNVGTLTTFNDPPISTSGWCGGKYGGGLIFDGTGDYVSIPDNNILDLSTFSIVTHVYQRSIASYYFMVTKTLGTGGATNNYELRTAAGILQLCGNGGAAASSTDGISFPINAWTQAVGTYNGTISNVYRDGKFVGTSNSVTYSATSTTLKFGTRDDFYTYYPGSISDVMIYNRALSPQEVAILYAFPYCMFEEENPYSILEYKKKSSNFIYWNLR